MRRGPPQAIMEFLCWSTYKAAKKFHFLQGQVYVNSRNLIHKLLLRMVSNNNGFCFNCVLNLILSTVQVTETFQNVY